jgi:hypothetical protein
MQPYEVDGRVVGYIAHLQGGGFCLAGANTLLLPVYLYVLDGEYDPDDAGFQFVLQEMYDRLTFLENLQAERSPEMQTYQPALVERADLWQTLIQGKVPKANRVESPDAAPNQMELSLTTLWGQDSPYNDQCPNLTTGQDERTKTGCVATAMSQIMNYWRWPNSGVGSASWSYNFRFRTNWDEEPLAIDPAIPTTPFNWAGRLEWTPSSGGRLRMNGYWDDSLYAEAWNINSSPNYRTALANLYGRLTGGITPINVNYGTSTYNWGLLQNTHSDPVDPADAEIAEIMLQVGVAHTMEYGLRASSTDWSEAAMENNFRYDPDYVEQEPPVANTLVSEIQWLRPVPFGGYRIDGSGHAWVLYGYNLTTSPWQYKMNMGWDGNNNGWYSMDSIPLSYNFGQDSMIRLAPLGVVRFVGNTTSGDGSPDSPYQNIEQAVSNAPNNTTLIFKAGTVNTFSDGTLTINKPLTLKGKNVTIQKP